MALVCNIYLSACFLQKEKWFRSETHCTREALGSDMLGFSTGKVTQDLPSEHEQKEELAEFMI